MIREQIRILKLRVINGELSYKEAEKLAAPLINEMNEKIKMIAKKYNKKPKLISFKSIRGV